MTTLRFLTWNINFKDLTPDRVIRIMALISRQNPDIICLQEVPISMVDHFQIPEYHRIGVSFQYEYNTIILSRFPYIRYDRYPLPETSMGRNLLLTNIILQSGKIIHVGTFHLESVFNQSPPTSASETLKMNQLRYIRSIIPPNTIIMGDTNLVSNGPLEIEGLYDLTEKSQPTFNNKSRLDRIITNFPPNSTPTLTPNSPPNPKIELIGTRSHSDHCGLIMNLSVSQ